MMMDISRAKCVVCNKMETTGGRKRTFYPFPRDVARCRSWIRVIGMENLVFMPLTELYQQLVCDEHFPLDLFSTGGSDLQVNLPTITQHTSLNDNIMALWPKSAMRGNPPQTRGLGVVNLAKDTQMSLLPDDYDKQLQTCLEQQLARTKYPISETQMTYSSSLEQKTILAARAPMNYYDSSNLPASLQFMRSAAPDNTQTKDLKVVVNVEAPIQDKSKAHENVTNTNVFYGLGTTISANKTVKSGTPKTRTTIEPRTNEQPITTLYQLLCNSEIDKSKIIQTYKPIKKSKNRKVSKSEVLGVPNTSNLKFMTAKYNTKSKKFEIFKTDPIEDEESESNTDGVTNTVHINDQNTQKKDSTNVKPEEDNNIRDSPRIFVGSVLDQRNVDYKIALLTCHELVAKIIEYRQ